MSYGNSNYGRRGGNFTPKPRPVLPSQHELQPRGEAAIADKADLKMFARKGPDGSRETITFQTDPARSSMPVPIACALAFNQCGIPPENQAFPALVKFDTQYDANHYHIKHEGPVAWIHDKSFRHIPCFSRYVIDVHGRVLNAHNGQKVEPANAFMIELVADGAWNGLSKTPIEDLLRLAFVALPEGFKDYGSRVYSHVWKTDTATGQCGWIARPAVMVRNNGNGVTKEFPNLPEAIKCCEGKFNNMKEWNEYIRNGLPAEKVVIGDLVIKLKEPKEQPPQLPTVAVDSASAPAASSSPEPEKEYNANDDFQF